MDNNTATSSLRERRGFGAKLSLSWTPRSVLDKFSPRLPGSKSPLSIASARSEEDFDDLLCAPDRLQKFLDLAEQSPKLFLKKLQSLQQDVLKEQDPQQACQTLCDCARVLQRQGKHSTSKIDAAELYKVALTLRPADLKVIYKTGNALYSAGRYEDAEATFRVGVSLPESSEATSIVATPVADTPTAVLDTTQFEVTKAPLAPIRARLYVNIGVACEAQEKLEEAAAAYRSAIFIYPDYASAHKLLGGVSIALGQMKRAETALSRAVELQPEFADAWTDLGTARRWLLDPQGAVQALETSVKLSPDKVVAVWNLALAHRDCESYTAAMHSLNRVLELQPSLWAAHTQHALCTLLTQPPPDGNTLALGYLQAAAVKAGHGPEDVSWHLHHLLRLPQASSSGSDEDLDAETLALCRPRTAADSNMSDLPLPPQVGETLAVLAKLWVRQLQRQYPATSPRGALRGPTPPLAGGPHGRTLLAYLYPSAAGSAAPSPAALPSEPSKNGPLSPATPQSLPEGAKVVKTSSGGYQVVMPAELPPVFPTRERCQSAPVPRTNHMPPVGEEASAGAAAKGLGEGRDCASPASILSPEEFPGGGPGGSAPGSEGRPPLATVSGGGRRGGSRGGGDSSRDTRSERQPQPGSGRKKENVPAPGSGNVKEEAVRAGREAENRKWITRSGRTVKEGRNEGQKKPTAETAQGGDVKKGSQEGGGEKWWRFRKGSTEPAVAGGDGGRGPGEGEGEGRPAGFLDRAGKRLFPHKHEKLEGEEPAAVVEKGRIVGMGGSGLTPEEMKEMKEMKASQGISRSLKDMAVFRVPRWSGEKGAAEPSGVGGGRGAGCSGDDDDDDDDDSEGDENAAVPLMSAEPRGNSGAATWSKVEVPQDLLRQRRPMPQEPLPEGVVRVEATMGASRGHTDESQWVAMDPNGMLEDKEVCAPLHVSPFQSPGKAAGVGNPMMRGSPGKVMMNPLCLGDDDDVLDDERELTLSPDADDFSELFKAMTAAPVEQEADKEEEEDEEEHMQDSTRLIQ